MPETDVQQILEELKQAYPEYEISSLTTKQRGDKYLFVIKGFDSAGDIDEWSINIVYPAFADIQKFLDQRENTLKNLRLLFVRGNQFVFYTPDIGQGNVFREMTQALHTECYGLYERQHYIGECLNINDVLSYLTTTNVWF